MKKIILLSAAAAALMTVVSVPQANAAKFGCKTAKLIVPWGPGGGTAVLFGLFEKYMNANGASPKIKVVTIPGQGGNKGAGESWCSFGGVRSD